MGIETSPDHGGAGSSFTSAIIAIEELAKIDPSVSVLCDVHNTLVNTVVRTYGTQEQKDKWLPLLAEKMVRSSDAFRTKNAHTYPSSVLSACLNPRLAQMLSPSKPAPGRRATTGLLTDPRCGLPTPTRPISSSSLPM